MQHLLLLLILHALKQVHTDQVQRAGRVRDFPSNSSPLLETRHHHSKALCGWAKARPPFCSTTSWCYLASGSFNLVKNRVPTQFLQL